jgi:predicted RNase H-like HicB family nuclease
MLTYKVAYYIAEDGVTAKALDFPAVLSGGKDLDEARMMVRSALAEVTQYFIETSRVIPSPNPNANDASADLIEPLTLEFAVTSTTDPVAVRAGA